MEPTPDFDDTESPFESGYVYNRQGGLHGQYGGQQQGGISTPADYPLVFLFTSEEGSEYGYRDEFRPDGTFWYTGEGQEGDMEMKRGNQAIRRHRENEDQLHLFEAVGEGDVRYIGQAAYLGHHREERPDVHGNQRSAIIFELAVEPTGPSGTGSGKAAAEDTDDEKGSTGAIRRWWTRPQDELRRLAIQTSRPSESEEETRRRLYQRSKAVQVYVKRRADGTCEGCRQDAPFETPSGRPYLEAHHLRRVSDGGPDHPRWVIALCPNCHRRVHHGKDGDEYNDELTARLGDIESP